MLRGPLHNRGVDGLCEACGEPWVCAAGEAIYESVVHGECAHYRRGEVQPDDSQRCLDCGVVLVSDG